MSAAVLPFTGKWHGGSGPTPRPMADARAVHDASTISAAKRSNDDWTARLLLALLQTLDRKQLQLLEFRLLGQNLNSESAVQALALVQLATGNNAHKRRVKEALTAIEAREAE